jgi:hypothetical protein
VFESTLAASNPFTLKIATLIFLMLLGFILLASLRGLMSIATSLEHWATMQVIREALPPVARKKGLVIPFAKPLEKGRSSVASPLAAK